MRLRPLAPAALVSLAAACAMPSLRLQPRYGRFEISGTAGASSGGVGGSADVAQAGLEEDDAPAGRLDFEFGSPHVIALGQAPRFEGTGTLDVTIDDGTNTIGSGATVASRLDLGQYSAAIVFDLVPGDMVELALGAGGAYLDMDFEFEELSSGTRVTSSLQAPVPLVVGAFSITVGPLELALVVGGMDYTYEEDSLTYLDGDASLRCKLLGGEERLRASLVGGYRMTELELLYDDGSAEIDTDLRVEGFYLGLELAL